MWDTFLDILLFVPRKIYEWFTDGVVFLINLIPAPAFLNDMDFNAIDSTNFAFWVDFLALDWGVTLIFGALIARFILRRIPLIG